MRVTQLWETTSSASCNATVEETGAASESQSTAPPVFAACFLSTLQDNASPKFAIVGCGPDLRVMCAQTGRCIATLRAHTDKIYAIAAFPKIAFFSSLESGAKAAGPVVLASAGADKLVVVWCWSASNPSAALAPSMRYSHSESVQCIATNPVSGTLCSASASQLALWSPETRTVTWRALTARPTSCSWSPSGMLLAVSLLSSSVLILNASGETISTISRRAQVWAVQWNPSPSFVPQFLRDSRLKNAEGAKKALAPTDFESIRRGVLVVSDWSGEIELYSSKGLHLTAKLPQVLQENQNAVGKILNIQHLPQGVGFIASGTSGSLVFCSPDRVVLSPISVWQKNQTNPGWNWGLSIASTSLSPSGVLILTGNSQGKIAVSKLEFNQVYAHDRSRFAYRDHFTDVVINDLQSAQACRLRLRSLVQGLAVYRSFVAVMIPSRIIIYKNLKASTDLVYQVENVINTNTPLHNSIVTNHSFEDLVSEAKDRFDSRIQLNLSFNNGEFANLETIAEVVAKIQNMSQSVLFGLLNNGIIICGGSACPGKTIENVCGTIAYLADFHGHVLRSWSLVSTAFCMKIIGGPCNTELILFGCENGDCVTIYGNQEGAPILLLQSQYAVIDLSMSRNRTRIAVIDKQKTCTIYDISGAWSYAVKASSLISDPAVVQWSEPGVSGVAFNAAHDDMISYSSEKGISVRANASVPAVLLPVFEKVVAFDGSRIFCQSTSEARRGTIVVNAPIVACVYQHIERREWEAALRVAALGGVLDDTWRTLALQALADFRCNEKFVKTCLAHVDDFKLLSAISYNLIAPMTRSETTSTGHNLQQNTQSQVATIARMATSLVFSGRLDEAILRFQDSGCFSDAVALCKDTYNFDRAMTIAVSAGLDTRHLVNAHAEMKRMRGDYEGAAAVFLANGDPSSALDILVSAEACDDVARLLKVQSQGSFSTESLDSAERLFSRNSKQIYRKTFDESCTDSESEDTESEDACEESTSFDSVEEVQQKAKVQLHENEKLFERLALILEHRGDFKGLTEMHLRAKNYRAAFAVAESISTAELREDLLAFVRIPMARYLISIGEHDEAEKNLRLANRLLAVCGLLRRRLVNALEVQDYLMAARFSLRISAAFRDVYFKTICDNKTKAAATETKNANILEEDSENLVFLQRKTQRKSQNSSSKTKKSQITRYALQASQVHDELADLFYALHYVHQYLCDQETTQSHRTLFCMARLIYVFTRQSTQQKNIGISCGASVLANPVLRKHLCGAGPTFALARLAYSTGAHAAASKLSSMLLLEHVLPNSWRSQLEKILLMSNTLEKRSNSLAVVAPMCHICHHQKQQNQSKDGIDFFEELLEIQPCEACGVAPVLSFHSFEPVPLVPLLFCPGTEIDSALETSKECSDQVSQRQWWPAGTGVCSGAYCGSPQLVVGSSSFEAAKEILRSRSATPEIIKVPAAHTSAYASRQAYYVLPKPYGNSDTASDDGSDPTDSEDEGSGVGDSSDDDKVGEAHKDTEKKVKPKFTPEKRQLRRLARRYCVCKGCLRLFLADEFESLAVLNAKSCPLCAHPVELNW